MRSSLDIAKELGVTAEDIEKKLNLEFTQQFGEHIEEVDGEKFFDAEVEEFLRLVFVKGDEAQEESAATWEVLVPVNADSDMVDINPAPAVMQLASTVLQDGPEILPMAPPVWQSIESPLLYQPEVLTQAVEQHRREISAFLSQFDRTVDKLVAGFPVKPGKDKKRVVRSR